MAIDTKRQRLFIAELGCTRAAAMQLMFGLYAALGLVALAVYRPLSPQVEIADEAPKAPLEQSKRLVYGMAALFGMDSFGTGFLVQLLLALWLYQEFRVSVTTAARSCSGAAFAQPSRISLRCRSPRGLGSSTRWCSRICRPTFS